MDALNPNQICCVIVTYNPGSSLIDLISIINKQVDQIIVVDNNSVEDGLQVISQIVETDNICLIRNEENLGIAKALNQGIKLGSKMGYNWAITFDQDTKPFTNIIEIILETYFAFPDREKIGAIGVSYLSHNFKNNHLVLKSDPYKVKDTLITSGCLLSVKTALDIGGFREDLFIDHVDEEYSLRLKRNGKVSLLTSKPGMFHECGIVRTFTFLGITFTSPNHNSLRRFYMSRNQVLLIRAYLFIYPIFVLKSNVFFLFDLFQMMIIDDNKKSKLVATIKGIAKGILYSSKNKRFYE